MNPAKDEPCSCDYTSAVKQHITTAVMCLGIKMCLKI